jgi:hypothetical protein
LLVLLSLGYCIETKQQTPPPSFSIVLDVHGACRAFLLVDVDENAESGLWIGMWMLDKTFKKKKTAAACYMQHAHCLLAAYISSNKL